MEAYFSLLIIGLLGSPHCGLMCGVFVPSSHKTLFNLGRLGSYVLQWAVIHFSGKFLEASLPWVGFSFRVYALTLILLVYFLAFSSWQGRNVSWPSFKFYKGIPSPSVGSENHLLKGFLLGFRGCGWLWAFLLALASLADSKKSFTLVCLFWLTTWPGLHLGDWILRKAPQLGSGMSLARKRALSLTLMATVQLLLWLGVWTLPDFSSEKAFQGLWAPSSQTKSAETLMLSPLQVLCHGQLRKYRIKD